MVSGFAKFCTNCRRRQFVQGRQFVVQHAMLNDKINSKSNYKQPVGVETLPLPAGSAVQ